MNISKFKISIPIPIFGLGCGVLGFSLAKFSVNIGSYASQLLKSLEYRGYDSTGAIIQDDKKNITLRKDVGAPSTLVKTLGIEELQGKTFCGQVRWATFGTVTKRNAQPHEVSCKRHIYGAHNGNITNTRELKHFLLSEGHNVVSDNDGEMLVHTVEHCFDIELERFPAKDHKKEDIRRECMRKAIVCAAQKMVGSYAAVIVDPITEFSYAIKAGSSLYFGIGEVEESNHFGLASSDLTAVLKFTKLLVNMREGEMVEFKNNNFQFYAFRKLKIKQPNQPDLIIQPCAKIEKKPVRSKLRAEDTELVQPYKHFMEQEIFAEIESSGKLIKLFNGGSNSGRHMIDFLKKESYFDEIEKLCAEILKLDDFEQQNEIFMSYYQQKEMNTFLKKIQTHYPAIYNESVKEDFEKKYFFSTDKNTFIDLLNSKYDKKKLLLAKALDSIAEQNDVKEFDKSIVHFTELVKNTQDNSRNIYAIACGTSFHACKVASLFFNEIAGIEIIPVLPGDFRGQYSNTLRDNDMILGVSQSGETKDLIDIFNYVESLELNIKMVVLVNNMNSTLGQEKSDVSIPIACGPEIAVPATKSFINQITLFYFLAIKISEMKFIRLKNVVKDKEILKFEEKKITDLFKSLDDIPHLIQETINSTRDEIEYVAGKIYMEPSMHILATKITGVAKEGALKIRETVLNHAEGGEASEFKHGPNTILGKNTVMGIKNVKAMIKHFNKTIDGLEELAEKNDIEPAERRKIARAVGNYVFTKAYPFNLSKKGTKLFNQIIPEYDFFKHAYRNYPLIYVTGPDEKDVNLTISQINTHKIRGGDTFVIAEENDKILENAKTNPHDKGYYGWGYIHLPKTGNSLMTAFSATIVLQLLALRMSVKKMEYLDRLNIMDHGVHPDVPKNVSKSITVD